MIGKVTLAPKSQWFTSPGPTYRAVFIFSTGVELQSTRFGSVTVLTAVTTCLAKKVEPTKLMQTTVIAVTVVCISSVSFLEQTDVTKMITKVTLAPNQC
jgi:hypothetical protein